MFNPFFFADGYKPSHLSMYPDSLIQIYQNGTPRGNKRMPYATHVLNFGIQAGVMFMHEIFYKEFFKRPTINMLINGGMSDEEARATVKSQAIEPIKNRYSQYFGRDFDVTLIDKLWDLGHLPIEVRQLPEGELVPFGVPLYTLKSTNDELAPIIPFLETMLSNLTWHALTAATIGYYFQKKIQQGAVETDREAYENGSSLYLGHDFSLRGLSGPWAGGMVALAHALTSNGSDNMLLFPYGEKYYMLSKDFSPIATVPASEHSIMCAYGQEEELETISHLMDLFPTGILSVVSDSWDLWQVIGEYSLLLKDKIMSRDGKLVFRPDSGNIVDIICGVNSRENMKTLKTYEEYKDFYKEVAVSRWEWMGVIESLYSIFGGTTNNQLYKVLDPHVGAIYGDAVTMERCDEIYNRLKSKGFATTNIVLGIGSYTYQGVTRDTTGYAVKATHVKLKGINPKDWALDGDKYVNGRGETLTLEQFENAKKDINREIFKDPVTSVNTNKKSAKGYLKVIKNADEEYELVEGVSEEDTFDGEMKLLYYNGQFSNLATYEEIQAIARKNLVSELVLP